MIQDKGTKPLNFVLYLMRIIPRIIEIIRAISVIKVIVMINCKD